MSIGITVCVNPAYPYMNFEEQFCYDVCPIGKYPSTSNNQCHSCTI